MTLEEKNVLVAVFMNEDNVIFHPPTGMYGGRSVVDKIDRYDELVVKYKYSVSLNYHSDMNLLYAACKKFCELPTDRPYTYNMGLWDKQTEIVLSLKLFDQPKTFDALCEGIIWLNKNKEDE